VWDEEIIYYIVKLLTDRLRVTLKGFSVVLGLVQLIAFILLDLGKTANKNKDIHFL
jgi:hypothetical protein